MSDHIDMLHYALGMARKGHPIFPVGPDKKPLVKNGFKSATTDQEQIQEWWTRHPGAGIGMPTGPASGCWVLDVDLPHGPETLAMLEAEHGPLPETPTQQTGGGGRQMFWRWNGRAIKNSAGQIGPGIDVRGDGGYVVMPPSLHHSGQRYQWIVSASTQPAPEWLVELAMRRTQATTDQTPPRQSPAGGTPYGRAAMERECGRMALAPEGQRNETLNRSAHALGQLVAGDELDHAQTVDALLVAAIRAGLGEAEAMKTIDSGMTAGMAVPRRLRDVCDVSKNKRRAPEASNSEGCDVIDVCDVSFQEEPEKCAALPPAPLDAFHPGVAQALEDIAKAKNCPVEIPLSAYLALVAGMIGRAAGLMIKRGWVEHANLFIATVARSGLGKSPATKKVLAPIRELERTFQQRFEYDLEQYDQALEAWQAKKKKKGVEPGPKPDPPTREDIEADDATIEGLIDAVAANPKGILWNRDELSGLLKDFDKYSGEKGATEARLMSAYDCGPVKVSRANKARTNYLPAFCITLFGTIQPFALKTVLKVKEARTGFLPRFNFIIASHHKPSLFTEAVESEATDQTLKKIVSGLYPLQLGEDKKPLIIPCSQEAKIVFIPWHDQQATEALLGVEEDEDSLLHKIRAQCLRLALGLHCVDAILDGKPINAPVSADVMIRACALATWLKEHSKAVWGILKGVSTQATGKEYRVGTALLALVDKITNGMLPTALIVERVNQGQDKRFHMSAKAVGKACAKLGLEKQGTREARGWTVTPDDVARLMELLKSNVANVDNVASEAGQGFPGATFENANVANVANMEVF